MTPAGRRPSATRSVFAIEEPELLLPDPIALDTSFVVEALIATQPLHAVCRALLHRIDESGVSITTSGLLPVEPKRFGYLRPPYASIRQSLQTIIISGRTVRVGFLMRISGSLRSVCGAPDRLHTGLRTIRGQVYAIPHMRMLIKRSRGTMAAVCGCRGALRGARWHPRAEFRPKSCLALANHRTQCRR